MRRTLLIAGSLLVASCIFAACGGGDGPTAGRADRPTPSSTAAARSDPSDPSDPSSPGAATRACDLLTEADVEAAFGEPVVAGTQTADECWWSTANDLKTVNLVRRHDDLATWRRGYANDFWTPNDFGDEGYSGTVLDSIVWRVGDTQYEVNVVFSTRGDPDRVVRDLATKAASRL